MRAVAVICFIIAGIALAGSAALTVRGLHEGPAYIIGTMLPALFFLFVGLVINHFASKRKASS
jgi:SNF family Na+-dependent transporter